VRRLLSGELDADAVFRRVWGVGIDTYFDARPRVEATLSRTHG
jgi:hypothetical protein